MALPNVSRRKIKATRKRPISLRTLQGHGFARRGRKDKFIELSEYPLHTCAQTRTKADSPVEKTAKSTIRNQCTAMATRPRAE